MNVLMKTRFSAVSSCFLLALLGFGFIVTEARTLSPGEGASEAAARVHAKVGSVPAFSKSPVTLRGMGKAAFVRAASAPKLFSIGEETLLPTGLAQQAARISRMEQVSPGAILDMERSVVDLLTGANGATPLQSSVQQIRDLVDKTLIPRVIAAHNSNEKELQKLHAAIGDCGNVKEHGVQLATSNKRKYETSSPLHKACRADEAALSTETSACEVAVKATRQVRDLKCKALKDIEDEFGSESRIKQVATKMSGESPKVYIQRITATFCGKGDGKPGGNMWEQYATAEKECEDAEEKMKSVEADCKSKAGSYKTKVGECNNIQTQMDQAACQQALIVKDACESYAQCFTSKRDAYNTTADVVVQEENDSKTEWKALQRMRCLTEAFEDGSVTDAEVVTCRERAYNVSNLDVEFPMMPTMLDCVVPDLYPATAAYKKAEFAPLPVLAKGDPDANQCFGVSEISTMPKAGSPDSCKCERVTMNGPYSAGALVKCTGCIDVAGSTDRDSCPEGTKIFSPRSRSDWKTFLSSAGPLRSPHWIIDVTRPQNGCGGCAQAPMNSETREQNSWVTSDGSPWWLRSTGFSEPSGDYTANCYLDLWQSFTEDSVSFNEQACAYHSDAYYCQAKMLSTTPNHGSPPGCLCEKVELTGRYSAGQLLKCVGCLDVSRSLDKNSCPEGTKIFSPRSREDWNTFLNSAAPLRSPHWIIDITRPENGCGGCAKNPMNFENPQQVSWVTSDGSPWWLRSTTYSEPNGDYSANCFMDLWHNPSSPDAVTWNDEGCNYHSNSYYCQTTLTGH